MKRNWLVAAVIFLALVAGPVARSSSAQAPQQAPAYSGPERDAYVNAANEKDPAQRVKLLDDFVAKYPNSTLLPYVFQTYFKTYAELRNLLKSIEYADKLVAQGDKVDAIQGLESARLEALEARARIFFLALNQRQITTNEQFSSARDAANQGLKFVEQRKKPEGVTDEQFKSQNDVLKSVFNSVGGLASRQLKDYKVAIDFFKALLVINPNDAATYYQIGLSGLQQDPPQFQDGFWAVARSVSLKVQGEAQIRTYLRKQVANYQQPACDSLLDAQLTELFTLAAGAAERPAGYSIPTRAELDKLLQENGTVEAITSNLKVGGDTAKRTWLAACGAEFPELIGKVFEVGENGDSVVLKIFSASTQEAAEAGTVPNLEVHVDGQPAAMRFKKDDLFVFAATLKSYTPEPFMLQLEKGKVREDTLPAVEKAPPKKAAPAKKAPPKKAPTKRPPA